MDNGVIIKETTVPVSAACTSKMGANGNPNAARLATLQERKQTIEETLSKHVQELRQLCIQEAELTGVMPAEIPLEPGESPPIFRRRVGTSFQLPQSLINNLDNEDESITSLELNMQVQANMAEAALSLANENNIGKTVRRQYMAQYQYHKRQYNVLEEKFAFLKARSSVSQQQAQTKQKKKPRPVDQEDAISSYSSQSEPFNTKSMLRHSMRSLQNSISEESSVDSISHSNLVHRNSDSLMEVPSMRSEDALVSGIYRLSLNGYKTYMERKGNHILGTLPHHISAHYISSHANTFPHQSMQPSYNLNIETLPNGTQIHSIHTQGHPIQYSPYNTLQYSQSMHEYPKYITNNNSLRMSSSPSRPNSTYSKFHYSEGAPTQHYPNEHPQLKTSPSQQLTVNPHQIQPHQQYEHNVMPSGGLGGYWKHLESGELVWCNISPRDNWQRDKRFGSLDRRKNKRLHKRTVPLVDIKSATMSAVSQFQEPARPGPTKMQQMTNRNSQDVRQLVRTQSLGSVSAQTVDSSIWPSDDNSSCGSDVHSINEINLASRRLKQKEWIETSLDGPAVPVVVRTHSLVPPPPPPPAAIVPPISAEEKYLDNAAPHHLPLTPTHIPIQKPILEIPAESNPHPSPTIPEPDMELFNNNIPKNGTLIQAGHCKPYHEETKPFEMADFYKYSTKFKKLSPKDPEPTKTASFYNANYSPTSPSYRRSLNDTLEETPRTTASSPHRHTVFNNSSNNNSSLINNSLNLSQLSDVAENFSAEMNAWYHHHSQERQLDKNQHITEQENIGNNGGRSTATFV